MSGEFCVDLIDRNYGFEHSFIAANRTAFEHQIA
jgi:hypothetical protein